MFRGLQLIFCFITRPKTICQNVLHWTSKPPFFFFFFVKLHHTEENQSLRPTQTKDPNSVSSLWCLETHYCPCYLVRRPLSHFGSALKEKKKKWQCHWFTHTPDRATNRTDTILCFQGIFFLFSTRIKPEMGLSLSLLQSSFSFFLWWPYCFSTRTGESKIQKPHALVWAVTNNLDFYR